MGITRGVEITIKKIAPFGDPIDIKLRDYELAIRKTDLKRERRHKLPRVEIFKGGNHYKPYRHQKDNKRIKLKKSLRT